MPNKGHKYCCAPWCDNSDKSSEKLRFFKFPSDVTVAQKWKEFISDNPSWQPSPHVYVCSSHFQEGLIPKAGRLRKGAFPGRLIQFYPVVSIGSLVSA